MDSNFELLCEKEAMWAEMFMEVLKDHDIVAVSFPVLGAGLVMKTGMRERLKIYVPKEKMSQARELMEELFAQEE